MHSATKGFMCVVDLLAVAALWRSVLQAQDPRPFTRMAAPAQQLITLTAESNQAQQLTVIDPTTRAMAVYHVDKATGRVSLKSVRQFHWDLQLEEFNGASPLPREIQTMLQR
jgi:hypothetical protein